MQKKITGEEFEKRYVRLNTLINTAINNIIRSANQKTVIVSSKQTAENLELMSFDASHVDSHSIDVKKNQTEPNINVLADLNTQMVITDLLSFGFTLVYIKK